MKKSRVVSTSAGHTSAAVQPDLFAIANKLRSCRLVLSVGGNVAGPVGVITSIVDEIDAWESGQSESKADE